MRKKESCWIIVSSIGTFLIGIGTLMLGLAAFCKLPNAANDALSAANKDYENKKFAYALQLKNLALEVYPMLKELEPNNKIPESNDKEKILDRIQILKPKLEALTGNTEELDKIANSYKVLEKPGSTNHFAIKQQINNSLEEIDRDTMDILKRSHLELNAKTLEKDKIK